MIIDTVFLVADVYENGKHMPPELVQEWESEKSVFELKKTILELGYQCEIITSKEKLISYLNHQKYYNQIIRPILFNLVEGFHSRNREAYIPALAEFLGCPHTGSDTYAQAISLDKILTKQIAKKAGVPTKKSGVITDHELFHLDFSSSSYFLKPIYEGSSLGINDHSIIQNQNDFEEYISNYQVKFTHLMWEEYLEGDEFTVGIFGNYSNYKPTKVARILSPEKIYSEKIKSKDEMPEKLIFDLDLNIENFIQKQSLNLCKELKISGYARLDWKLDKLGNPFFLEINLTPGLSKFYSTLPICYIETFNSYKTMIQEIIQFSVEEFQNPRFNYGKIKW